MRHIIVVLFIMFLIGCEGKEGATGPAGPTGLDGQTGQTGNANIIVVTFNVNAFSFTIVNNDARLYIYLIDIPDFTSNDGAVLLYMRSASGSWFQQLPINEPTWPLSIVYYFDAPTILLDVRTDVGNARSKMIQYFNGETNYLGRLVIIPEGTTMPKNMDDIESREGVKYLILSNNELITKMDF